MTCARNAEHHNKLHKMLRKFGRDEDGAMIVLSLFLIVMMLVLGGMAVDFMRLETQRAKLQGVSDRAALAAASLQVSHNATSSKEVAIDYFVKAGMEDNLLGEPQVEQGDNFRSVSVLSQATMNTFFLKLVDIPELRAEAQSTAIEGVGEIEISLVVDISGSMDDETFNEDGSPTGMTKIAKLREAATAFVDTVLDPEYRDRISVSLVPYSQDVNLGPTLFGRLKTDHLHDFSHCIRLPDSAFSTLAIDTAATFQQQQHFQTNLEPDYAPDITQPVCPHNPYERVTHITQDRAALNTQIAALQPRAGTSIFLGLKWGLALLDPSMQPIVASGLDPAFAGRPAPYATSDSPNSTLKIVILMTDGENQWTANLLDTHYETPSQRNHWNNFNLPYFLINHANFKVPWSSFIYTRYGTENFPGLVDGYETDADVLTANLCNEARNKGVTIYSVAFEATEHGKSVMANCATSPTYYYDASGGELTQIFRAIAAQITDLRLTQ